MLTAANGGRSTPLVGGVEYRPNHNFWPDAQRSEQFALGLIQVPNGIDHALGQHFEARIKFYVWPDLAAEMKPGRSWRIQEATKIVGYGSILRIIE